MHKTCCQKGSMNIGSKVLNKSGSLVPQQLNEIFFLLFKIILTSKALKLERSLLPIQPGHVLLSR